MEPGFDESTIFWEIWSSDLFDRDARPLVETNGEGLARGLSELWLRHLDETVQANGSLGLTRFHLGWERGQVHIHGNTRGGLRLKQWLIPAGPLSSEDYLDQETAAPLLRLGRMHLRVLDHPDAAQLLLEAAATADDFASFGSVFEALH